MPEYQSDKKRQTNIIPRISLVAHVRESESGKERVASLFFTDLLYNVIITTVILTECNVRVSVCPPTCCKPGFYAACGIIEAHYPR
jgi:hypothetical protein